MGAFGEMTREVVSESLSGVTWFGMRASWSLSVLEISVEMGAASEEASVSVWWAMLLSWALKTR